MKHLPVGVSIFPRTKAHQTNGNDMPTESEDILAALRLTLFPIAFLFVSTLAMPKDFQIRFDQRHQYPYSPLIQHANPHPSLIQYP